MCRVIMNVRSNKSLKFINIHQIIIIIILLKFSFHLELYLGIVSLK